MIKKINNHFWLGVGIIMIIGFISIYISAKSIASSFATDYSGNGYHGNIIGPIERNNQGVSGESLYFNGNSTMLTISDNSEIDLSGSLTVEAWVLSDALPSQLPAKRIISKDRRGVRGSFILWEKGGVDPVSQFVTVTNEDIIQSSANESFSTSEWTHVVGVYDFDNKKNRLYINGQKVDEVDAPDVLNPSNESITIGASADNKHNWIGNIDEVRIYTRALSDIEINDSYNHLTVFDDDSLEVHYTFDSTPSNPVLASDTLTVWAIADPHVHTDFYNPLPGTSPYLSLKEALDDAEGVHGKGFSYDFGIIAGDVAGGQGCPSAHPEEESVEILHQFNAAGVDPNLFYSIVGNHGLNQSSAEWFKKWVDPLGGNTEFSGIDNSSPVRKELSGYWDHYSFEEGNILFLMLGDNNFGGPPLGRDCSIHGGYPAGRYSVETFEWWKRQVEQNPDKIIITVAHHALLDTTMNTGLCDGWVSGSHGGHSWADKRGSSMVYAIGNDTIDGLTDEIMSNNSIDTAEACYALGTETSRNFGFKKYLQDNPGAIDMWLHGHTHARTTPDFIDSDGRSAIEHKHGVSFVNLGALTTRHGMPGAPYSRLLNFSDGSDFVHIQTYLHRDWDSDITGPWDTGKTGDNIVPEGFYDNVETSLPLSKNFVK